MIAAYRAGAMPPPRKRSALSAGAVALLHGAALYAVLHLLGNAPAARTLARASVELVQIELKAPERLEPIERPKPPALAKQSPPKPEPKPIAATTQAPPAPAAPLTEALLYRSTAPAAETAPLVASAPAASTSPAPAPSATPPLSRLELPRSDADYLNNPSAPYPPLSRRLSESGRVVLRVLVGEDGRVQQAQVRSSSGYARLDDVALTTVQRWQFKPGQRGGVPEAMWVNVPIDFKLD